MNGERWEAMDMAQANSECGTRNGLKSETCKKCDSRVMLHCPNCSIQVTGCVCTEVDRFGKDAEGIQKIYERMAEREGPEGARARLAALGFHVPKGIELS